MSIEKSSCPKCPSSDAYVEYETNFYCFSCHYFKKKKDAVFAAKHDVSTNDKQVIIHQEAIPQYILNELAKMHFTPDLLAKYGIVYASRIDIYKQPENSCYWQRLVIPTTRIFDNIVYFEAKTFTKGVMPKYISHGDKTIFKTFLGETPDTVCIVEDLLSAMRVGKIMPCIALRTTGLRKEDLAALLSTYKRRYLLWLDNDKAGIDGTRELKRELEWNGMVEIIKSEKDPKYYTDKEIREYLSCA